MKFKMLNKDSQKTFAIILENGESVIDCLTDFANQQNVRSAQFTAIGALRTLTLGFYNFNDRVYKKIDIDEQIEVLSLIGDVSLYNNTPKIHAHVVVGKENGTAHGGHLLDGIVHPTLEIILTQSPAHLERKMNEEFGIPLIQIDTLNSNPVPQ
jgi:predicted DNA-binding protein with PD1-like motif